MSIFQRFKNFSLNDDYFTFEKKGGKRDTRSSHSSNNYSRRNIHFSREIVSREKVIVPSIYFQIYFPCSLKTQNIFLKASKTKGDKKKKQKEEEGKTEEK